VIRGGGGVLGARGRPVASGGGNGFPGGNLPPVAQQSSEQEDLHYRVAARLGKVEQRYTDKRRSLVEELLDAGRPVAINEIIAQRTDLPQSSVYRNLTVLEEAGVVRRVAGPDEFTRYELAEDLTEHHHHLVCMSCGAVADYTPPLRVERTIERAAEEITARTGFRAQHHSLDFVGLCSLCERG
jgi:Fur family ferric uptake transcriptional regulator